MGVLKVRVGGAWQSLGSAGGPQPAGGVLGDILVKQSATLSDATWGTAMPKLNLTQPYTGYVGLTGVPTLQIGPTADQNTALYATGIQQRNNGAVALFRLNYYGGSVV